MSQCNIIPMLTKRLYLVTIAIIIFAGNSSSSEAPPPPPPVNTLDKYTPLICPADYQYYGQVKRCYKIYNNKPVPWEFARKACQKEKADLVIIHNDETRNVIEMLAKESQISTPMWLGLRQSHSTECQFKWIDDEPVVFANWRPHDSVYEPCSQQCVEIDPKHKYTWFATNCSFTKSAICEKNVDISPLCPIGYISNTQQDMCYKIRTEKYTFDESRSMCQQEKGGDLVSITDSATKDFIISITAPSIDVFPRYWIGIKGKGNRELKWVLGNSLEIFPGPTHNADSETSCAILEFHMEQYNCTDENSEFEYPSICQTNISTSYPVLDCPVGFAAYISSNGGNTTCLMIEIDKPERWKNAMHMCEIQNSRLFSFESDEYDFRSFLGNDAYWSGHSMPKVYFLEREELKEVKLTETFPYICQHWGYIRVRMNLKVAASFIRGQNLLPIHDQNQKTYFVNDVCRSESGTAGFIFYDWTIMNFLRWLMNNDTVSCADETISNACCAEVILSRQQREEMNPAEMQMKIPSDKRSCVCPEEDNGRISTIEHSTNTLSPTQHNTETDLLTEQNTGTTSSSEQNTKMMSPTENNEVMPLTEHNAVVTSPTDKNTYTTSMAEPNTEMTSLTEHFTDTTSTTEQETDMMSSTEHYTQMATPIETETFDHLRNITCRKNDSTAINNLCPCRCDTLKIDFNPSPEVLSQIVASIQKELRVKTEKLSSKINRKISAKDNRSESRVIGYVGIALCFVPLGFIVAFDLVRIFQSRNKIFAQQ